MKFFIIVFCSCIFSVAHAQYSTEEGELQTIQEFFVKDGRVINVVTNHKEGQAQYNTQAQRQRNNVVRVLEENGWAAGMSQQEKDESTHYTVFVADNYFYNSHDKDHGLWPILITNDSTQYYHAREPNCILVVIVNDFRSVKIVETVVQEQLQCFFLTNYVLEQGA